jgi:hypothetical protein
MKYLKSRLSSEAHFEVVGGLFFAMLVEGELFLKTN